MIPEPRQVAAGRTGVPIDINDPATRRSVPTDPARNELSR